jgi:murein L,D-transpeptidase YcbB/YkuD
MAKSHNLTATCLVALVCPLMLATPAAPAAAKPTVHAARVPETASSALKHVLAATKSAAAPVAAFYAARDYRPVWTGSDEAQAQGAKVLSVLAHADQQGLEDADYAVPPPHAQPKFGRVAAEYDVAITSALFRYAHDVSLGRVAPDSVYKQIQLPVTTFDVGEALAASLDDGGLDKFFADLPPPHPEYKRLVEALAHYRAVAARGGWQKLSRGASREALIARLDDEDPVLAAMANPGADELKAAVMRFQLHHGLDVDGNAGSGTLSALNVSADSRVKEIEANLERWRWLPRHFEDRTIQVNVAAQRVDFIDDGEIRLTSKVVVGQKSMPTPILRTFAMGVIANPAWDIPDDIAAKSILPHLRHDADYLKKRGLALVDAPEGVEIDWKKVKANAMPYQIQQLPGPKNGLGQVMLDMPNTFYVYLHGTEDPKLFNRDDREISHGCVRVEKIEKLAELALGDTVSDPGQTMQEAIAGGTTRSFTLDDPVPVYLVYWTAAANDDGTVDFYPDIYDRDPKLLRMLDKKSS